MTLQWLLRLPASLRCQLISPLNAGLMQRRTCIETTAKSQRFSTASSRLARQPPKVSPKKPPPPSPKQHKPSRTPGQQSNVHRETPPPPHSTASGVDIQLQRLLQSLGKVLIYRAPNHTSFYFNSYILGLIFLIGAYGTAKFNESERPIPWYVRTITALTAGFFAIFGTAFILAPTKMIRSVYLVASPSSVGRAVLRFETKSSVPFVKRLGYGNTFDVEMYEVTMDEKLTADAIPYYNVPMDQAEKFTELGTSPYRPTFRERLGIHNNNLINLWPTLRQDIRRMFIRDGIAYVRIEGRGDWKLDIHHAQLLDGGKPIIASLAVGDMDRSVFRKIVDTIAR